MGNLRAGSSGQHIAYSGQDDRLIMRQVIEAAFSRRRDLFFLICGAAFFAAYLIVASQLNFFEVRNPMYVVAYCGYDLWKDLAGSAMRYFDPQQVSAMFWKTILLLPAVVLISLGIIRGREGRLDERIQRLSRFMATRYPLVLSLAFSGIVIVFLTYSFALS